MHTYREVTMVKLYEFETNDKTGVFFMKALFVFSKHVLPAACVGTLVLMALFGDNPELALSPPSNTLLLELTTYFTAAGSVIYGSYKTIEELLSLPMKTSDNPMNSKTIRSSAASKHKSTTKKGMAPSPNNKPKR